MAHEKGRDAIPVCEPKDDGELGQSRIVALVPDFRSNIFRPVRIR